MMKKLQAAGYGLCVLVGLVMMAWSPAAEAHVLKTDGSIGAVLHVDPEDDPIVGQPASFFFEFKDTKGQFSAVDCDCTAVISRGGQTLLTEPLASAGQGPSLSSSSFTFTFPSRDVYTLTVTGKPTNGAKFHSFRLQYDLRVDRTDTSSQNASTNQSWLRTAVLVIGLLLFIGVVMYDQRARRRRPTGDNGEASALQKKVSQSPSNMKGNKP